MNSSKATVTQTGLTVNDGERDAAVVLITGNTFAKFAVEEEGEFVTRDSFEELQRLFAGRKQRREQAEAKKRKRTPLLVTLLKASDGSMHDAEIRGMSIDGGRVLGTSNLSDYRYGGTILKRLSPDERLQYQALRATLDEARKALDAWEDTVALQGNATRVAERVDSGEALYTKSGVLVRDVQTV